MPESPSLATRWRSEPGASKAEEVVARLVSGRPLDGLDLGERAGRIDLRGLPAPIPQRLRRFATEGWFVEALGDLVTFRGVTLTGLDLSGAQLESLRFFDSALANCRFDGAVCRDWRLWNTTITNCSFARANLRGAAVGTWHDGHRNEWRNVDFADADFRAAVSSAALYEDCNFSAARLARVNFAQCALVRCRFAGPLREVVFDGRELPDRAAPLPLVDVDFAEARFDQVEFQGYRLDRVTIPADTDIRLIRNYHCVVEHTLGLLEGDDSLPGRMLRSEFQNRLRMLRGEEDNLFNARDYRADGEDVEALATSLLARAEAECAA